MGMDPWEYAAEEAYERHLEQIYVEELRGRAVNEFTTDNLVSFYLDNPEETKKIRDIFLDAENLRKAHASASLLYYATVTEIAFKLVILKPIVYGLVHEKELADLIVSIVLKQRQTEVIKDLLFGILEKYAGINITKFKIDGHKQSVWEEYSQVQKARNDFMHTGKPIDTNLVALARDIADVVVNGVISDLIKNIGLGLDGNYVVQNPKKLKGRE